MDLFEKRCPGLGLDIFKGTHFKAIKQRINAMGLINEEEHLQTYEGTACQSLDGLELNQALYPLELRTCSSIKMGITHLLYYF